MVSSLLASATENDPTQRSAGTEDGDLAYLLFTAVVIGLGSGLLLWEMRRRRRLVASSAGLGDAGIPPAVQRRKRDFRAVGITWDIQASPCPLAQDLAGQRFLLAEAPPLPLPDCPKRQCSCHYRRYTDRRLEDVRRAIHGLHEGVCSQSGVRDRRRARDRREPS